MSPAPGLPFPPFNNQFYTSMKNIYYFLLNLLLIPCIGGAAEFSWTTVAGRQGGPGSADGPAVEARFDWPLGVAADGAGNTYVADTSNYTIRKVSPSGAVTTLAGLARSSGSADGTGSEARFRFPWGVDVDGVGNVYVADANNQTIRRISPEGAVIVLAGLVGEPGSADGAGAEARFGGPLGVAVDGSGNVYVADTGNRTIRRISPEGGVTTLAGMAKAQGSADGTGSAARFRRPVGLTSDRSGNIFVADSENHTIRKITPHGVVTTLAGSAGISGSADGAGGAARFNNPHDVAVDGEGNIYVADSDNHLIRKISPGSIVTTLAGKAGVEGGEDGTGGAARFHSPIAVSLNMDGNIIVADSNNHVIRKVTSEGEVTTLAGSLPSYGSVDGTGTAARFVFPYGVAVAGDGNVYVGDGGDNIIRKISPAGEVSTFAGKAGTPGSADGTGAAARFGLPHGVAVDGAGNLYVTDPLEHTIRKVTPGRVVTTLAGRTGVSGSANGTGGAARFDFPQGIAVDQSGNIYVADAGNATIRKITSNGVVTTLAGRVGESGSADGTGGAARFSFPQGVAVDKDGNVYISDENNHTIRKITPAGAVTTLAGKPREPGSQDGVGTAAHFNSPSGIAVDEHGNLYVGDFENSTIRKISSEGVVSTIGGSAGVRGSADGTSDSAHFSMPAGVAVDREGVVYVVDLEGAIRRGISAPLYSGLEAWRRHHFGSAAQNSGVASNEFDFDHDGLVNLVEYAFGFDPKASIPAQQLPQWQLVEGSITATFAHPDKVSGITYLAEWSTNLFGEEWTPVPDEGSDGLHVFRVFVEGRPRLFVRLKVILEP